MGVQDRDWYHEGTGKLARPASASSSEKPSLTPDRKRSIERSFWLDTDRVQATRHSRPGSGGTWLLVVVVFVVVAVLWAVVRYVRKH